MTKPKSSLLNNPPRGQEQLKTSINKMLWEASSSLPLLGVHGGLGGEKVGRVGGMEGEGTGSVCEITLF